MRETDCARFLDRLDRGDAAVSGDPHPEICASCRAARETAAVIRLAMKRRSVGPSDFAARVATLAWLDAQDRRARARGPRLALMGVPVAVSAVGIAFAFAVPVILQNLQNLGDVYRQGIASIGGLPMESIHLAGIALVGTAMLALVAARVTRART